VRGPTASGAIGAQATAPSANVGAAARASAGGEARTALRPNIDATAGTQAATNFRTNWNNLTPAQRQAFRTTFGSAVNARAAANTAAMNNWLQANPARAAYWSNWGGNVRNNFVFGPSPYFNSGFWGGRNLVGLGLGSGFALGGWGAAYAPGYGWWGYSPWLGYQPWNYWYGNPGWNTFAGYYGWQSPYFYDYGPNGNVVYTSNRVLVNDQPVGTPTDYAQSAAELAMVTPEQMNAQHEWIPLGTFSVATSQDETNPARVIQLAHDNKQGLISGTIFNKESGNLYTVQGRVDPDTQRVAFTIGKDPNVVMETGLFNLTQNETPVLVHFGPSKTATYLFARLPEPQQSESAEGAAATATAPPPPPPADDFRRE
jgi:hypothetical protein